MASKKESQLSPQDIEAIPLSRILGSISGKQAWAVTTVLLAICAAVFVGGYKLGGIVSGSEVAKKDLEVVQGNQSVEAALATAQKCEEEVGDLKDKDIFLSLSLRLERAQADSERQEAQRTLESWLRSKYVNGAIEYRKGQVDRASITFPDGASWPLPVGPGFNCEMAFALIARETPNPRSGDRQIIVVTR